MAWLLVPLQYLFVVWRAQRYIAKASAAAGTRKHAPYLKKATKAVIAAEILQRRFPHVTNWIDIRSEEHTSELQSLMRISYAVFCLKKKKKQYKKNKHKRNHI